jgi:hypothetical protein
MALLDYNRLQRSEPLRANILVDGARRGDKGAPVAVYGAFVATEGDDGAKLSA